MNKVVIIKLIVQQVRIFSSAYVIMLTQDIMKHVYQSV